MSIIDKAIRDAVASGLEGIDHTVLKMNKDKQWDLKKYTDKDSDGGNDRAYKAACAYFATILNLETLSGKDLDPNALFQPCVDAGAILKGNAYINSYEKIAQVAGVKVKRFVAEYIEGRVEKMCELLRSGVPLVIYIGAPSDLDHVEACYGYITGKFDTMFFVQDPGWQSDTHIGEDLRMLHFEGGVRKYSVWKSPPVQRKAYKFGYFEV